MLNVFRHLPPSVVLAASFCEASPDTLQRSTNTHMQTSTRTRTRTLTRTRTHAHTPRNKRSVDQVQIALMMRGNRSVQCNVLTA